MSPDDAPRVREVVIAQLTLPSGVAEWSAVVNAQGRSTSGEGEDWDVYNMRFGMPLSLSEPSGASSESHLLGIYNSSPTLETLEAHPSLSRPTRTPGRAFVQVAITPTRWINFIF